MKKIYFLLAFFSFGFSLQAQIVNIPDANFKARLLDASPNNIIASISIPDFSINNQVTTYNSIDTNNDGEIQVSEASVIRYLDLSGSQIVSLEGINSFINLISLRCYNNQIQSIDVSGLINIQFIDISANQFTTLNISGYLNLKYFVCDSNQLTSINVSGLTNLIYLDCSYNLLTSLNLNGLNNLRLFRCSVNQIPNIDVSGLINLEEFYCSGNQLSSLNLSGLANLHTLLCDNNQLTSLDLNGLSNLSGLNCYNNQLTSLFLKTGNVNWSFYNFNYNLNLTYICIDDEDVNLFQTRLDLYGYTNCVLNSYCSFTPGGAYYTIQGNSLIDFNTNGCDPMDGSVPNLKYNVINGIISGSIISNGSGNYSIPVQAGSHSITPQLENPTYFSITPSNAIISFPAQTSPFTQNFCITPNGVHHDLKVVIVPIEEAIPGFDIRYKIKYKNKGNQTENATVIFNYNDALLDYVSATIVPNSQSTGTATWNIGTLVPFQIGEIIVVLNLNSPTETPPVNANDILSYSATINGLFPDATTIDNSALLNQIVVNSFDPNDKTCLEGVTITPDRIGQYVHYKIRFENTGTFAAQNIVVKDMIDISKFDLSTLQITDTSHSCVTRITNPDKVEFIFEDINLPFDDANNDGYVVFKIKTKSTLVLGNTFSNSASIYFDYNFPIITNTATTTIQALANQDFEFSNYFELAPNPAKNVLQIQSKKDIELSSISIYNTLGQLVLVLTNAKETSTLDVSHLTSGTYFVKVVTDRGASSEKFIKE